MRAVPWRHRERRRQGSQVARNAARGFHGARKDGRAIGRRAFLQNQRGQAADAGVPETADRGTALATGSAGEVVCGRDPAALEGRPLQLQGLKLGQTLVSKTGGSGYILLRLFFVSKESHAANSFWRSGVFTFGFDRGGRTWRLRSLRKTPGCADRQDAEQPGDFV